MSLCVYFFLFPTWFFHITETFGPGGGTYFSTSRDCQTISPGFESLRVILAVLEGELGRAWSPSLHPSPCPSLRNLGRGLGPPPSTLTGVLMSPESAGALGSWSPQPAPSVCSSSSAVSSPAPQPSPLLSPPASPASASWDGRKGGVLLPTVSFQPRLSSTRNGLSV